MRHRGGVRAQGGSYQSGCWVLRCLVVVLGGGAWWWCQVAADLLDRLSCGRPARLAAPDEWPWNARSVAARWPAAVRHAFHPSLRVWRALDRAGAVSRRTRILRAGDRPAAHRHPAGRYARLALPDHARGSARTTTDADRGCGADGGGGCGVRVYARDVAAGSRRNGWRHQSKRSRGRPLPADRTGGAVAGRARSPANGSLRLVHAGWI